MTEDNQQKFAFVCWISGKFDQTHTLGVNDTAYLIEWKEKISKKKKETIRRLASV